MKPIFTTFVELDTETAARYPHWSAGESMPLGEADTIAAAKKIASKIANQYRLTGSLVVYGRTPTAYIFYARKDTNRPNWTNA